MFDLWLYRWIWWCFKFICGRTFCFIENDMYCRSLKHTKMVLSRLFLENLTNNEEKGQWRCMKYSLRLEVDRIYWFGGRRHDSSFSIKFSVDDGYHKLVGEMHHIVWSKRTRLIGRQWWKLQIDVGDFINSGQLFVGPPLY